MNNLIELGEGQQSIYYFRLMIIRGLVKSILSDTEFKHHHFLVGVGHL